MAERKISTKPKPEISITETTTDQDVYVNDKWLAKRYGVSRKTIWQWVRENSFPKPKNLSPKCTRWYMGRVREWEGQQS